MPAALATLTDWQNFYVIVGSSAGALTGLQFVVITLIADARVASSMREIRAFGTPTIVHFCMVLFVSALASCPWQTVSAPAAAFACCGLGGVAYTLSTIRHAKKQTGYQPDWEDWLWYSWLPLGIYLGLAVSAFVLAGQIAAGTFLIAAFSLALLFTGIHNAWDTVTYIAVQRPGK